MRLKQSFEQFITREQERLARQKDELNKLRQTQVWAKNLEDFFMHMGMALDGVELDYAHRFIHAQSNVATIGENHYRYESLFDPETGERHVSFYQCPIAGKPDQKFSILATRFSNGGSEVSSVHATKIVPNHACNSPQELVREIALRMTERPELYDKAREAWDKKFPLENSLPALISAGKLHARKPGFTQKPVAQTPLTTAYERRIAPKPTENPLAKAEDRKLGVVDRSGRGWFL